MAGISGVGGASAPHNVSLQAPANARPVSGTNNAQPQEPPQRVEQSSTTLRSTETGKGNVIDVIG